MSLWEKLKPTKAGKRLQDEETEDPNDDSDIKLRDSPRRLEGDYPTSKLEIPLRTFIMFWNRQDDADLGRPPLNHLVECVFAQCGIPIVQFPNKDPDIHALYQSTIDTVKSRFHRRWKKIRKAGGVTKANVDLDEVLFHLGERPQLIDPKLFEAADDVDLPASQASGQSIRSSQRSEIEEEVPLQPPDVSKPWDRLSDEYKRKKSNKLFKLFLEFCAKHEADEVDMICEFGHRLTYHNDRELAKTFRAIAQEDYRFPVMSVEKSCFLKATLELTRGKWTFLRNKLADSVRLSTYGEIHAFEIRNLPALEPFHDGWYIPMNKIVESTLKTLPDEVSHFDFISNTYLSSML